MAKNTGKSFERFVYEIYKVLTKDNQFSSVEHNVKLEGKDGPRQIDVLLRMHVANAEILIIIECRDYAKRLDVIQIDAFDSKLRDVNASKGILVSRKGFSSTARAKAARLGIILCQASFANEVMEGVDLKIPVRVNMIESSYGVKCKMSDDFIKLRPTTKRASLTINGVYLPEQFHKDILSGHIKMPTRSSEDKWVPSDIHPPYVFLNESGQPITPDSIEFTAYHKVRYFFGFHSDIPSLAVLHTIDSKSSTFACPPLEAATIEAKLTEFSSSESRPAASVIICLFGKEGP